MSSTPFYEVCNDAQALQSHSTRLAANVPSTGTLLLPMNAFWKERLKGIEDDRERLSLWLTTAITGTILRACDCTLGYAPLTKYNDGAQDVYKLVMTTSALKAHSHEQFKKHVYHAVLGRSRMRTVITCGSWPWPEFPGETVAQFLTTVAGKLGEKGVVNCEVLKWGHNKVDVSCAGGGLVIKTFPRQSLEDMLRDVERLKSLERDLAAAQDKIKEQARQIELLAERPLKRIKEEPQDDKGSSKRARVG